MLKSTEKLLNHAQEDWTMSEPTLYEHLKEIEREVSERYIERDKAIEAPLDADGVPIHMGDTVEGELLDNTAVRGAVTTYHIHGNDEPDTVYVKVDCGGGVWTIKELRINRCRHVKPRTIKDILREVVKSGTPTGEGGLYYEDAIFEKYANELRDMFGGEE